jgi:hypothetical protein
MLSSAGSPTRPAVFTHFPTINPIALRRDRENAGRLAKKACMRKTGFPVQAPAKNLLFPLAEMPERQAVLCKYFTGKAETALLPYLRSIRSPAGTEQAVRLVRVQAVFLIVRAYAAVLHADRPVLISILNGNRADFHVFCMVRPGIIGFSSAKRTVNKRKREM